MDETTEREEGDENGNVEVYAQGAGKKLFRIVAPCVFVGNALVVTRCYYIGRNGQRRWKKKDGYVISHPKTGIRIVENIRDKQCAIAFCEALSDIHSWSDVTSWEELESDPYLDIRVRHVWEQVVAGQARSMPADHAMQIDELNRLFEKQDDRDDQDGN